VKQLIISLVLFSGLFSKELIYISDNIEINNLTLLNNKYKKDLIINDNRAYLVPDECLLVRHFGGLSQNKVNLVKSDNYSLNVPVTQEVFTAKNTTVIDIEVEKQKSMDLVTGKATKEFLPDKDGHLFGGLSEIPIDLTEQIADAKNEYMKEKIVPKTIAKKDKVNISPGCELLKDGSGYKLIDTSKLKVFTEGSLKVLETTTFTFN